MIRTIKDFEFLWSQEIESTQKILKHMTDRSLQQAIGPEDRTLGRLAWHIVHVSVIAVLLAITGVGVRLGGWF